MHRLRALIAVLSASGVLVFPATHLRANATTMPPPSAAKTTWGGLPNLDGKIRDGVIAQVPPSGIKITHAFSVTVFNYQCAPICFSAPEECVFFTNMNPRVADYLEFVFAWYEHNGKKDGDEWLDVFGTFSRGVPIENWPNGIQNSYDEGPECRDNNIGSNTANFIATVVSVHYKDSKVWRLIPPVPGSALNAPSSGTELGAVRAYVGSIPPKPTPMKMRSSAPIEACADITNTSSEPISHVQIVFGHVEPSGIVAGDEPLDVHTTIAPGSTLDAQCRPFSGASNVDVVRYARAAARGRSLPAPTIIYDHQPSRIEAWVSEVDYANGTSWHAPSRP